MTNKKLDVQTTC